MQRSETVVLVHGFCGSPLDMWPIARRLRRIGYGVVNWGYQSIGTRIESRADRLAQKLLTLDGRVPTKFHLVTHSLGGIIARAALANARFEKLGRVVMLAPPHRGSHIARKCSPYFAWLAPSLRQLSDDPDSYVNHLENSLLEHSIDFGIVESAKDRVIAKGCVHLEGCRDFAVVDGHHAILTWYRQTIRLVENFLTRGQFSPAKAHSEKQFGQIVDA